MANYLDYIDWRGDIVFAYDGFCEVDALIFAQLAYLPFDGIVESGFENIMTLGQAAESYFKAHTPEQLEATALLRDTTLLLRKMMAAPRYKNIRLMNYQADYDPEQAKQFGAVTLEIEADTYYVAFRGTDDTLAGWQEDFQVCYKMPVASQIAAEAYLADTLCHIGGEIYVGGHSKGGNLAMYSSMRMERRLKEKITSVFNFDGPGFMEEVVLTPEYLAIQDRIHSYMPQESLVGMILYHEGAYTIVNCTDRGIAQHTANTWQTKGRRFETAEGFKSTSLLFNAAVRKWITQISDSEREFFVELVFSVLENGGESFTEMVNNPGTALTSIYRSYRGQDKETKKMARNILGQLIRLSTVTVKEQIRMNQSSSTTTKQIEADK